VTKTRAVMFASRFHRRLLAVLAACLFALLFGTSTSSANEVPWRDLGEATRQYNVAVTLLADIDKALIATDQEIAATASTMGFVAAREGDRIGTLEIWRQRSRTLAVESYIHGGPGQASLALLNTKLSMDLSYQSELLRGQAEAALGASERYAELVGGTDDDVVDFVEGIDALSERIIGLETDRERALVMIADAEWVVTIANVRLGRTRLLRINQPLRRQHRQWLLRCLSVRLPDLVHRRRSSRHPRRPGTTRGTGRTGKVAVLTAWQPALARVRLSP